jgi:protein-L-isoaspartate(D-aspartate) O-methyltransferase
MENRNFFSSKIQLLFTLLTNGYLKDIRLFQAFLDVNLEDFVPKEILPQVRLYDDSPVVFFFDKEYHETVRTISAPHMISIMLQELMLKEDDDLLILGAKSGYIACLAHNLASKGKITILEANPKIAKITSENLSKLNLNNNIRVIIQNPLLGYPDLKPWQKILVTGAIKQERIHYLLRQLDPNEGVLFAPIGEDFVQVYTQIIRYENDFYGKKHLQVRFTPLITKVELDNLKLAKDLESSSTDRESEENEEEKYSLDNENIMIDYSIKILANVQLEPQNEPQSKIINPENIFKVFLEYIDRTIDKLKEGTDFGQWSDSVYNFDIMLEILKKIKNDIKIDIETLYNTFGQIKKRIGEIEKDSKLKKLLLEKKRDLLDQELNEVNLFQKKIKEEIYHLFK